MLTKVSEGFRWMAASADDPAATEQTWAEDRTRSQVLPTGRAYDVVIVRNDYGMEAWDLLRRYNLPCPPIALHRKSAEMAFFLSFTHGRALFDKLTALYGPRTVAYQYLADGQEFPVPGPDLDPDAAWEWLDEPRYWPSGGEIDDSSTVSLALMLAAAGWILYRTKDWGAVPVHAWEVCTTPRGIAARVKGYLRARAQLMKGIGR